MEDEFKILGFCEYCKGSIQIGKPYSVDKDGNKYHDDCKVQKNTYYDPFELENNEK